MGFQQLQELAHQQGGQNYRAGSLLIHLVILKKSAVQVGVVHTRHESKHMNVHEDFKNMDSSRPNCLRFAPYLAKLATNASSFINLSLDASNAYVSFSCSNCFSLNCPLSHFTALLPISGKCYEIASKFSGNIPFLCAVCLVRTESILE